MRSRVAISGLGGSGTRVFAELIRQFGYHIGDDLNHASDNLWWTLLFKRRSVLLDDAHKLEMLYDAFVNRMGNRQQIDWETVAEEIRLLANGDRLQHKVDWLQQRLDSFCTIPKQPRVDQPYWGWKEPNTHIVAEFLLEYDPKLTLIHVVRDPIYMSFSANQNQLALWGPMLLDADVEFTPASSLAYWHQTHLRLEKIAERFKRRLIFVSHDYACKNPVKTINDLADLVGVDLTEQMQHEASALITSDQVTSVSDKKRGYPFSEFDIRGSTDFMDRQFGSPVSRLYRSCD